MSCHPGHDHECSILVLFVSEILSHTPGFRVFASLPGMTMKQEYEAIHFPLNSSINSSICGASVKMLFQ